MGEGKATAAVADRQNKKYKPVSKYGRTWFSGDGDVTVVLDRPVDTNGNIVTRRVPR